MARINILNNQVLDNSIITGDGVFRLFESALITSNNNNALDVHIEYKNNLPDPNSGIGINYQLFAMLETKDDIGNYHAFHRQFDIFNNSISGQNQILTVNPNTFLLEEGISDNIWDGEKTITQISKTQSALPDDFRVVILCREKAFGSAGEFQQVTVNASYEMQAL